MKYINYSILLLFIILQLACSKEEKQVFNIPRDYRLWNRPAKLLDYPVPGHGPTFRVIYANDIAYKVKTDKGADGYKHALYPEGSVIIKEVYEKQKDVNWADPELTIMVKDSSNEDAKEGWLYYVRQPGEKQATLIKGRMCIGCHEAANERHPYFDGNTADVFRDYIFVDIAK